MGPKGCVAIRHRKAYPLNLGLCVIPVVDFSLQAYNNNGLLLRLVNHDYGFELHKIQRPFFLSSKRLLSKGKNYIKLPHRRFRSQRPQIICPALTK